jgi:hypothetical protein
MNAIALRRRFLWLPLLGIVTLSGALILCNRLVWTPVERYYLGTYLRCSLLGIDRTSWAEVRWLNKTAPTGKQELAVDADVVRASSGGEGRIPLELSPAARQAGWTGLMQEEGEWFQATRLQALLQRAFYGGDSIWRVLLTPLLWGLAMFFSLLAGWNMWQSWFPYKRWDMERFEWGSPPPSFVERWRTRTKTGMKMSRIRLRLPGLSKEKMAERAPKPTPPAPATAPTDPPKKPTQPALPLFGSAMGTPNGKPKEGFRWEKTKGIE